MFDFGGENDPRGGLNVRHGPRSRGIITDGLRGPVHLKTGKPEMHSVQPFRTAFVGMAAWASILARRRQANGGAGSNIHDMAFKPANGARNPCRALENESDRKKTRRPARPNAHLMVILAHGSN